MKKEDFKTFIAKYSLGGCVSKVKWKYISSEKKLHTRSTANNRSFIVDVIMNDFSELGSEDLLICIGDTERVEKMLSPFSEDITLSVNKIGDRILGFTISDPDCESYCTAADPTSMDPVPKNLQDIPEYHVIIPLTTEIIDKFLKSRMALKDLSLFSVGMNKKGLFEIVIGYTTSNSNRIRITPKTDPTYNKLKNSLSFPMENVYEVLKSNQDMENGVLSINESGILKLAYENPKYSCTYYQFCNKKV